MDDLRPSFNHETFEHWLRVERLHAMKEEKLVHTFNFHEAEQQYQLRWVCLDLALDSLQKGLIENPHKGKA